MAHAIQTPTHPTDETLASAPLPSGFREVSRRRVSVDGAPMAFERDIVWVTLPGHRQTEKWLHDLADPMASGAAV